MNKQPHTYVGISLILIGVAVFLLAIFGIRALDAHDQWYLPHFYGVQRAPNVTYDDLFAYASILLKQRGHAWFCFFYTLTISCVTLGAVLLAWARDRKRLRDLTKQSPNMRMGCKSPAD
jgi:purine-cytosine permease-like protein